MKKDRKISNRYTNGVTFSAFTPQEILKLSVVEVKNPQNFDALGYPTAGGVYDPALGPNERNELCSTCSQNYVHCPGHLGHIQLPLPVFNPVFFNTLYQILRGSCLSCHSILVPTTVSLLVQAQLTALDYGLVEVSLELEELVSEKLSSSKQDDVIHLKSVLDNHLANALNGIDKKEFIKNNQVKNVIECRSHIIRCFIKEHMMKNIRKCPHCDISKYPIYSINRSRLVVSSVRSRRAVTNMEKNRSMEGNDKSERIMNGETLEEDLVVMEEVEENSSKPEPITIKQGQQTILTPVEARKHMREIWTKEKGLLKCLYKILATSDHEIPVDIFFLELIAVPPSRFRPINVVSDKKFENPQSAMLSKVVQSCFTLKYLINLMKTNQTANISDSVKGLLEKLPGDSNAEKLQNAWSALQNQINLVLDSDQDILMNKGAVMGVKQLIEKKEGLFRKNMMGKRVDYAARSVISPDPFIGIDEIGIPEVFAKKLTYPQSVTPWNVRELRQLVMNGPKIYPGATLVKNEFGDATLLSDNDIQREAIAKTLLTPSLGEDLKGPKVVHRHLKNGDILLVNRQPTLHRPSIMAHRARILPGEKTLRLHYSNCKTYNADFDGDEMNIHFPQNEMARAEAELIANVSNHYLVPKDGTPLGGLIQDHIVAGIHMTIRGRFFSKEDYQQLVFSALAEHNGPILTLPPSILKPQRLWSGKQVFSTVLKNMIPADKAYINLIGQAKIDLKSWQTSMKHPLTNIDMTESEVIISDGELLCGVLDKAHYGPTPYGLIHCCYELYGGNISSQILTSMGRLFTYYLQIHGFTLGIEDILVDETMDKKRKKIMRKAHKVGLAAAGKAFSLQDCDNVELIKDKYLEAHYSKNDRLMNILDMYMKNETDSINNKINKLLMPSGLLKQFPENNLQLMVQSGAKGASVNCMQISCLLGQIELEGKRPPLMLSGRTLPSFLSYDMSPRAGGFIDGRFLTGIQPQEYFFHCMAGREGLIDTAVKTSRSGYLQRCLIKHLEGVCIHYDLTVRDSDGSVIQFLYGEDGLDVQKTPFFKEKFLPFLTRNSASVLKYDELEKLQQFMDINPPKKKIKSIRKWKKNHPESHRNSPFLELCKMYPHLTKTELQELWFGLNDEEMKHCRKLSRSCPDPVVSIYRPDLCFGSVTENLDSLIESYISSNPDDLISNDDFANKIDKSMFRNMMYQKIMHSLCPSGESVGLLAAQSVGEPSTQMTLNTFHFAGRGEMNVTLGIPRLREILMVASSNIATPSLEIPFQDRCSMKTAEELKLKLNKVYLSEVMEDAHIHEWLSVTENERARLYRVRLNFLPYSQYKKRFYVHPSKILFFVETIFIKQLIRAMDRKFRLLAESRLLTSATRLEKKKINQNENEENEGINGGGERGKGGAESSEDEHGDDDDDAAEVQHKRKHQQEREYEEQEDEEQEGSDQSEIEDSDDEPDEKVKGDTEKSIDSDDEDVQNYSTNDLILHKKIEQKAKKRRIQRILNSYSLVCDYSFDIKREEWCEITFKFGIKNSKIDLMSVLEEELRKAIVHEVPNITRAFITESNGKTYLKTEGVNIEEMFKYDKILNLSQLYCNDIHAVANVYGIEAATRVIHKEIKSVFQVYGIHVDPRHLLLIADYMTFSGMYKPFNRVGLESNSSPLQQMSFETTMHFLKSATLAGRKDTLTSPSAQIVVGKPVSLGTGSMEILIPLG